MLLLVPAGYLQVFAVPLLPLLFSTSGFSKSYHLQCLLVRGCDCSISKCCSISCIGCQYFCLSGMHVFLVQLFAMDVYSICITFQCLLCLQCYCLCSLQYVQFPWCLYRLYCLYGRLSAQHQRLADLADTNNRETHRKLAEILSTPKVTEMLYRHHSGTMQKSGALDTFRHQKCGHS